MPCRVTSVNYTIDLLEIKLLFEHEDGRAKVECRFETDTL